MAFKVSKLTNAERERRQILQARETPQSLAGMLLVAEAFAQSTHIASWRLANGDLMPLSERYDSVKRSILEMQLQELEDEPVDPTTFNGD